MSKINLPHIFNYLTFFTLGCFICFNFFLGKLPLLIHPRYTYTTLASGKIIIIVGIVGVIYEIRNSNSNKNTIKNLFSQLVNWNFIVCIVSVLILFFPLNTLSSRSFSIRSSQSNINFTNNEKQQIAVKFENNIDTKTLKFIDWVTAKYLNENKFFEGKEFLGEGFITQGENDKQFKISRFIVNCCAVDASPVYLLVEYDYTSQFKIDDWVKIEGVFEIKQINGKNEPVIKPKKIEKISQPNDAYLSRN